MQQWPRGQQPPMIVHRCQSGTIQQQMWEQGRSQQTAGAVLTATGVANIGMVAWLVSMREQIVFNSGRDVGLSCCLH